MPMVSLESVVYCYLEGLFLTNLKDYHVPIYRINMSESLGERGMLLEQEPLGQCFHSFFKFSQTFMNVSLT